MKIILYTSILILIFIIQWGAKAFPMIFGYPIIQWLAIVLFSLLIPICFAKSLVEYFNVESKKLKSLSISLFFLIIYFGQLIVPLFSIHAHKNILLNMNTNNDMAFNALELLSSNAAVPESRKFSAQLLFQEFGKKVPYKGKNDQYIIFEPTTEDQKRYNENSKFREERERLTNNLLKQSEINMYSVIIQVLSFLIVVPIMLVLNNKK